MGLGEQSLWTAMDVQKGEFFASFGRVINELILGHQVDLERRRWEQAAGPTVPRDIFVANQSVKSRWVDGTPQYSYHICGLRLLFPHAQFIHVLRDVTSVVRSMLNFHRLAGVKLVANEQEAYAVWYRNVTACLLAEQAYGPRVVFRLRYSQLVDESEVSLRALLGFLGEPYTAECLVPLKQRINSSNVPVDFKLGEPDSDSEIIERALQLNAEIETSPQPGESSTSGADKLETEFNDQLALDKAYATAHTEFVKANARAKRLAKELENKRAVIRALKARH
jgi:Sulfotransferase family